MIISELFARLGLQVDEASFRKADAAIGKVSGTLTKLGAAFAGYLSARAVGGFFERVGARADELDAMAQSSGVATQALQKLEYAGKFANVSLEEIAGGLRFLSRNAYEAATGNKEAIAAFRDLGVAVTDAAGQVLPAEQLLGAVADRMQAMPDGARKAALAMQVLGRGGTRLIPMLNEGRAGLAARGAEAQRFGLVLSDSQKDVRQRFADQIDRMRGRLQGLGERVADRGLPLILRWLDRLGAWLDRNQGKVAKFIGDFGGTGASILNGAATTLGTIVDLLSRVTGATSGTTAAIVAFGAAFASAFGIDGLKWAFLGLVIEDIFKYFTDPKIESVTGHLVESFKELAALVKLDGFWETLKGVWDFALQGAQKFFDFLDEKLGIRRALNSLVPDWITGLADIGAAAHGGAGRSWEPAAELPASSGRTVVMGPTQVTINAAGADAREVGEILEQKLSDRERSAMEQLGPAR